MSVGCSDFFTCRYTRVRRDMAALLRDGVGERLPGGLIPERAAPLLAAVLDGSQYQWLLDPETADMAALFRDFLDLLGAGGAGGVRDGGPAGGEGTLGVK